MEAVFGLNLFVVFLFRHAEKVRSVAAFLDYAHNSWRSQKHNKQQQYYFSSKFHVAKIGANLKNQKRQPQIYTKINIKKAEIVVVDFGFWFGFLLTD